MNVEFTEDGHKKLFNWDNVITAGHPGHNNVSGKIELWCIGNVIWHIDETYEEMLAIVALTESQRKKS